MSKRKEADLREFDELGDKLVDFLNPLIRNDEIEEVKAIVAKIALLSMKEGYALGYGDWTEDTDIADSNSHGIIE